MKLKRYMSYDNGELFFKSIENKGIEHNLNDFQEIWCDFQISKVGSLDFLKFRPNGTPGVVEYRSWFWGY